MVFGSNTGAKLLFVLAAVFALMPFVSANMSGPEPILAIPAIALFLFMSNAGFNLLAILAVQKLFLGSFFEKLKPRRIIAILAGVTLLGFFSDFIGFTVTTWLGNNVAELYYGSMPLLNAAIMYFIISFAIFLLDLIFLAVVIRMPKKQALLISAGIGLFTNPMIFLGGMSYGPIALLIPLAGPVLLGLEAHYLKKRATSANRKKMADLEAAVIAISLLAFIVAIFALLLGPIFPQPEPPLGQSIQTGLHEIRNLRA